MERKEKAGDLAPEKQEIFGIKLKQGILVGKREGPCTPLPTWKLGFSHDNNTIKAQFTLPSTISARKLGANLWEIQHLSLSKMNKAGVRIRHHKDKGLELPTHLADPSHSLPDQLASASTLRRHVAASLIQRHQLIERNDRALQPISPSSCSSSMEMAAYTPTGSLGFKGRLGESAYSLKTSTELLKVLNRIWSLEEQHASNRSSVKALKIELLHARAHIKELLKEQQADRHEIDDLIKQVTEDKLARKSKEEDRIKAAVQSVSDELENERKLRKRSESLHRKLAQERSEVKFSYSKALKELERERKARALLEDLCDEFAKGIGDYEQVVRALKHKSKSDSSGRDDHDQLILHVSEAWLDDRMQIKLAEARCDLAEKNKIVDKLSFEIETFFRAKRSDNSKNNDILLPKACKDSCLHRHSVHLNESVSAAQVVGEEEDSIENDSHCLELNKNAGEKQSNGCSGEDEIEDHLIEITKSDRTKKKLGSRERTNIRNPSSLQLQFEEKMAWAMSCNGGKIQLMDREHGKIGEDEVNPVEISISQKSENCEAAQKGSNVRKSKQEGTHRSNSSHVEENLIRSWLLSDGGKIHPENECREESCAHSPWRGNASPVQQWVSRFTSPDIEISETSSKWPQGLIENTLKAKLLEARLEVQHSRSKVTKGSS